MTPTALYLHIPFCASKCAYCDFNSVVAGADLQALYLRALTEEIARTGSFYNERVFTTVYLGGGTPTLLGPQALCQLLTEIRRRYNLSPDAEITCEANPGTVDAESLAIMREHGFNRLSLGVQSFNDDELELLGRRHDAAQARRALGEARAAGFTNLSLDLINALPGQTPDEWEDTLQEAIAFRPQHLSCYGLSIEDDTPLARLVDAGTLQMPDEDLGPVIYELTHDLCSAAGYEHYEISNFALDGYRCRHNENYWRNGEYVGLGAGAVSYLNGHRMKHEPDARRWAEAALVGMAPTLVEREALDDEQRAAETLMLALRTSEGLDLKRFGRQFDLDLTRFAVRLKALKESGLALDLPGKLVLDPVKGFLLQSEIAQMFM